MKKYFLIIIFVFQLSLFSDSNSDQNLIMSVKRNNMEGIEKAIEDGVSERAVHTALFWAIDYSSYDAVKMLIDKGADVNYKLHGDSFLVNALRKNNKDIVWLLIKEKADINQKDSNGYSPLLIACWFGKKEFAEFFIKNKAEINIKDKPTGYTPLLLTAGRGYIDLMKLMIKYNADINEQDIKGYTPLMNSVKNGQYEEVELLIKSGADINIKSSEGYTALSLARSFGKKDVFNLLKKLNANDGKNFDSSRNSY